MNAHLLGRLFAVAILASLAGCTSGATTAPTGGPSPLASGSITVSGAWVRAAATAATPTAAYLTISNGSAQDDALLGATSPGASSVELHETSMDSSGMAGMRPVDKVAVASGATVKLEPGGYHLMVMGLTKPLKVGDTLELDLSFQRAGKVVVQAEVRQG